MHNAYIGLGTNLGNLQKNLKKAKILIMERKIEIKKESSILETKPVDFLDQPDFLNQIIEIETGYSPKELLDILKDIEKKMKRKKTIPKGPRIIDLDILLYDDIIFMSKDLIIPHSEIKNRKFILTHLIELNSGLRDPLSGEYYRSML